MIKSEENWYFSNFTLILILFFSRPNSLYFSLSQFPFNSLYLFVSFPFNSLFLSVSFPFNSLFLFVSFPFLSFFCLISLYVSLSLLLSFPSRLSPLCQSGLVGSVTTSFLLMEIVQFRTPIPPKGTYYEHFRSLACSLRAVYGPGALSKMALHITWYSEAIWSSVVTSFCLITSNSGWGVVSKLDASSIYSTLDRLRMERCIQIGCF